MQISVRLFKLVEHEIERNEKYIQTLYYFSILFYGMIAVYYFKMLQKCKKQKERVREIKKEIEIQTNT